MAFIDSTSTQRVELLRQAEKVGNLTRRVTVGSGNLGVPEGAEGSTLCASLADALADIGYGTVIGEDQAVVTNAQTLTVKTFDGATASSGSIATVTGGEVTSVTMPTAVAVAGNGGAVPGGVVNSAGGDTHPATYTVAGGKVTNVKITAATTAMVDQADTVSVQNSAGANGIGGTAQVAAGVITSVRLPAASAAISNGAALTVPVTGTYTTTATVAIANGVITGITLS